MNQGNRKYENLLKMIYLNTCCPNFMLPVVMVCVTSSTILSLLIFNFSSVFKITLVDTCNNGMHTMARKMMNSVQ